MKRVAVDSGDATWDDCGTCTRGTVPDNVVGDRERARRAVHRRRRRLRSLNVGKPNEHKPDREDQRALSQHSTRHGTKTRHDTQLPCHQPLLNTRLHHRPNTRGACRVGDYESILAAEDDTGVPSSTSGGVTRDPEVLERVAGAFDALPRGACSTGSKPGLMHGGRAAGLSFGFWVAFVGGECVHAAQGRPSRA